jgi:hypothetical protein
MFAKKHAGEFACMMTHRRIAGPDVDPRRQENPVHELQVPQCTNRSVQMYPKVHEAMTEDARIVSKTSPLQQRSDIFHKP